jgi:Flp pilus assembly pilin Flp
MIAEREIRTTIQGGNIAMEFHGCIDMLKGRTLTCALAHFAGDENGQDMIEYALFVGLVGLGAIVAIKALAVKVGNAFTSIGTSLTTNV